MLIVLVLPAEVVLGLVWVSCFDSAWLLVAARMVSFHCLPAFTPVLSACAVVGPLALKLFCFRRGVYLVLLDFAVLYNGGPWLPHGLTGVYYSFTRGYHILLDYL